MPLVERRITLTCVSNQVGDHYVGNATWLGVPMRALLERAGVKSGADCLVSTSDDDMTISTPIQALTDDRDALLAVGMNGAPLPLKHGFPARMVVPGLYGYVSATKWVVDMEVTKFSEGVDVLDRPRLGRAGADQDREPDRRPAPVRVGHGGQRSTSPASPTPSAAASRRSRSASTTGTGRRPASPPRTRSTTGASGSSPGTPPRASTRSSSARRTRPDYTQTSDRVPPRPDGATGWHSTTVNVR